MIAKKKLIAVLAAALLICGIAGTFVFAYFEKSKIGVLDENKVREYNWKEIERDNINNRGVGYAISTYMPADGRQGNLKIMTYSYPSPKGFMGNRTKDLALETSIWNAKSYDMTFTNIEKKKETIREEVAEVIYIDMTTNTSVDSRITIRSYGRFIIVAFSPSDASVIRDCFVLVVSYSLFKHEVYQGNLMLYQTAEDRSAYNEMKDLIFNHICLVQFA